MITGEKLAEEFRDYFNNYLTVEAFADHRGINVDTARHIIDAGREYHELQAALASNRPIPV